MYNKLTSILFSSTLLISSVVNIYPHHCSNCYKKCDNEAEQSEIEEIFISLEESNRLKIGNKTFDPINNVAKDKVIKTINNKFFKEKGARNFIIWKITEDTFSSFNRKKRIITNFGDKYILASVHVRNDKYYTIYCKNENLSALYMFDRAKNIIKAIILSSDNNMTATYFINSGGNNITNLNLPKSNIKNIENMSHMFSGCSCLKEINLYNLNTENVKNMSHMFSRCTSLEELDLSRFNTKKVTNMSHMFSGCKKLKKLNLSNFNTQHVTDMTYLLADCNDDLEIIVGDKNSTNANLINKLEEYGYTSNNNCVYSKPHKL